jgi:hypothetical protein
MWRSAREQMRSAIDPAFWNNDAEEESTAALQLL